MEAAEIAKSIVIGFAAADLEGIAFESNLLKLQKFIADALTEAYRAGMIESAEIARNFPAISHGHLRTSPAETSTQVSAEIATAIEQAAKISDKSPTKPDTE